MRRTLLRLAALWLLGAVSGACARDITTDDPTEQALLPADPRPVLLDSAEYTLVGREGMLQTTALATYVNTTSSPVYFVRCMPSDTLPINGVMRAEPDTTRHFVGYGWACVGGVPAGVVPPGGRLTVPVWLGSADSPYANPPITMAHRTGTFRVVLALCRSYDAYTEQCDALPLEQRSSRVFRLNPPAGSSAARPSQSVLPERMTIPAR